MKLYSPFFDFKKAFDCVSHDVLLSKLRYYGVRGIALVWCESYLSGRRQFTVCGDSNSDEKVVGFGVPQGSILGPLLFLIFIDDLPNASSFFRYTLFADDSSLTAKFSRNDTNIANKLNVELEYVNVWLQANRIAVNADKTKYIQFSASPRQMLNLPLIRIGDIKIKETSEITFLGLYLDRNLSFKAHVMYISKKLARAVGVLNN